jgi:glutaminyl-tRNA synthetase
MAVIRPLKVILTNWRSDRREALPMENHPDHPEMGARNALFTRELYIEREDFMEVPVKKYFRMFPGGEVRLKGAYIVRCDGCEKDEAGNIKAVLCTVDMDTKNGTEGAKRKVKGTLHWVSAEENIPFEARLYEPLLLEEAGDDEAPEPAEAANKKNLAANINPSSVEICQGYLEKCLDAAQVGETFQFLRMGYFCKDADSTPQKHVFNRVVSLKDSFSKQLQELHP